jgi:uncharacterized protein (UPF0264 family)
MTGLLVSVRSAAEAVVALAAGADLIDVKEPGHGPLGKADSGVIRGVVEAVAGRVPLSAALGELLELHRGAVLPKGLAYAKVGLSGCAPCRDWRDRWAVALAELSPGVVPVAVAYADWRTASAPAPIEVLHQGVRLGCGAALLDTYRKGAGSLFDYCGDKEVADWIALARRLGLQVVVAGSLAEHSIARAAALRPDYIAVRGAACRGGRGGQIDAERITRLRGCFALSPNAS